jgi:hypothetical protein
VDDKKPSAPKSHRKGINYKLRGELGEAAFLSKAISLGFRVAKPWGDSDPFDFLVYTGSHCWRVQVKTAHDHSCRRYQIRASADGFRYTKDNIDFLVAYIAPRKLWYVIPVEAIGSRMNFWFCPYPGSKSQFELYREAWCLMACPADGHCNQAIVVKRRCQADHCPACPYGPAEFKQ